MSELEYYQPLKLKAENNHDLNIFSTYLQDALCSITSMSFDPNTQIFTCLINRFCWELTEHYHKHQSYFRVHSALTIKNVQTVHQRNFHQASLERTLNLLSISVLLNPNDEIHLRLLFSHDCEMNLKVSEIHCLLADFEHPWVTQKKPTHIHEHLDEFKKTA